MIVLTEYVPPLRKMISEAQAAKVILGPLVCQPKEDFYNSEVQEEQLLVLKKLKTEIKFAVFKDVFESEVMKNNQMNLNNVMKTTQEVVAEVQTQSSLLDEFRHSIYFRTVTSYCLFFTLLNWLKLV